MPICYKINILAALKEKGFSTYRIRKDKLLSESTLQAFRNGEPVSWDNIARICEMLDCQPGDLLYYNKEAAESPCEYESGRLLQNRAMYFSQPLPSWPDLAKADFFL